MTSNLFRECLANVPEDIYNEIDKKFDIMGNATCRTASTANAINLTPTLQRLFSIAICNRASVAIVGIKRLKSPTKRVLVMKNHITQELVIFDNNNKAGLHICFCDKDLHLTTMTPDGQYDFQISREVLMGFMTIYKEHCKNIDNDATIHNTRTDRKADRVGV